MSEKRNRLMVILLCVNALLLAAVVIRYTGEPQAYAQVRPHDYILIPGQYQAYQQIVWIIDLETFQLTNCMYDRNSRMIVFGNVVPLPSALR
jgi:hypothetical protein